MSFTISYITNRLEPKFEWFFSSLASNGGDGLTVNIVDFHAESRKEKVHKLAQKHGISIGRHTEPMPNVWQGKYRLTKEDFFAASNASNTAIAICPTSWVVFVDDLSVLRPNWLNCVKDATLRDGITCGAYKKVFELKVRAGKVESFKENPVGNDIRAQATGWDNVNPCLGQWFFGCSFVAPINALLDINGFDSDCDGMGYQDCVAGKMLESHGVKFWYDSRMVTFESEELHHQEGNTFHRLDPGISPNDKSHRILELVSRGRKTAPNYFGEGGLRRVRERTLLGYQFPVIQVPEHEWFTGKRLAELP